MSAASNRLRLRVVPGAEKPGLVARDKVVEVSGVDETEAERRLAR